MLSGSFVMRILVIEDNHRLNSSLAASLVHEGYSVDSAYDGQEGQDLAEMTAYDLIILDILLPGKDRLEVCRDLRRRRIHKSIADFAEGAGNRPDADGLAGWHRLDFPHRRRHRHRLRLLPRPPGRAPGPHRRLAYRVTLYDRSMSKSGALAH